MEKKRYAIVLAAGQGKRMQSATAKQFLLLKNYPILYYSLKAFEDSIVDEIILVTGENEIEYCKTQIVEQYGFKKIKAVIAGGKERYHSVYNGIQEIKKKHKENDSQDDIVLIHDGARPFVTVEMIADLCKETEKYGACVTATLVKDTIKITDAEGFCVQTPDRKSLWAVQTPQVFQLQLISGAYSKLIQQEKNLVEQKVSITDDAMAVEYFSDRKVKMVAGSYNNIKITTPEDLVFAEAILNKNKIN